MSKYFWVLSNYQIREIDENKYRELNKLNYENKGLSYFIVYVTGRELNLAKGPSHIWIRKDTMMKLLGE